MHNLNAYNGISDKPAWHPHVMEDLVQNSEMIVKKIDYEFYSKYPIYVVNNFFSGQFCNKLIHDFDQQEQYAVGVDGYCNPETDVGSYRAMAWAEELAGVMTAKMKAIVTEKDFSIAPVTVVHSEGATTVSGYDDLSTDGCRFAVPFGLQEMRDGMKLLGSTPWLRFMKYKAGGMHTPHHDAPFHEQDEKYITLFSWVLYLNDLPLGSRGNLQMVDDLKQKGKHPLFWDTSDWTNMSNEINFGVKPVAGKLVIFPHWLCHQVEEYTGEDFRYIIRGDLAYGY